MHQSGDEAMNEVQMARLLGLLSLKLGALELLFGRRISHQLGIGKHEVVDAFGAREIANGLAVLTHPDSSLPIWGRVAGDVMDLALLASALGSGNRRRHNAAWTAIGVLGITLIDIAVAVTLTRREQKALATGQRTRIRRPLGSPMPKTA
jgi:hypothetical protein